MNQKKILENYLKEMFEIYKKNNFEEFVNYYYNYNIELGHFKKKIFGISEKIYLSILSILTENKANFTHIETNNNYKVNVVYLYKNYSTPKAIISVPLFEENYEKITKLIFLFLIKEKENFNFKLNKIKKNPLLEIKVDDINIAKKIVDLFEFEQNFKNETYSRISPFIPQKNLIGISCDYKPYNYNSFYIKYLYEFFSKIKNVDEVSIESLQNFFESKYKNSKKLNIKRMFLIIYKTIYIINNDKDIFSLFDYNSELKIGSYDTSSYELKKDKNNLVYFKSKEDNNIIFYGSENYLNLTYSKFYENIIKKEKNNLYYSYFFNIFSKILSNNYENIDKLLDFSSVNNDFTYQYMMLVSSCFFAYRKMNFSLDIIYEVLSIVLLKNYKIDINITNYEENIENKAKKMVFPLSIKYGNKVIDTKKGGKTTVIEYFKKYNVLDSIPKNSKVYLKNGEIETGEAFLYKIYLYIPKYDDFQSLVSELINIVEFQ